MNDPLSTAALSVVVPSVNGWANLDGCLAALGREREMAQMEVLVPERCGPSVRDAIARRYPWVRVLPVPNDTSIPEMRARAFRLATAPTVAVIEDHILVPASWARQMIEGRTKTARVIGGGLVNAATDRTVDWAAWFCEYSQLAAPATPGPAKWLTGNNTAYDRDLLEEFRSVVEAGRWENVLHDAFRRRGIGLWNRPDIVVQHKMHCSVGGYLSQRFLFARAFAGARLGDAGAARRFCYGLLALALPPVLFGRIVIRVWRGGRHRRELIRSLPLLAIFVSAWGLGEVTGSWFGAGDALAKVT